MDWNKLVEELKWKGIAVQETGIEWVLKIDDQLFDICLKEGSCRIYGTKDSQELRKALMEILAYRIAMFGKHNGFHFLSEVSLLAASDSEMNNVLSPMLREGFFPKTATHI